MTTSLRRAALARIPYDPTEPPEAVITVRVPRSTHRLLQAEAHDQRTSLNRLCVSKLIAAIDACPILPPFESPTTQMARRLREELAGLDHAQSAEDFNPRQPLSVAS